MRPLALFLSTLFFSPLYAAEVDVYLLGGQSNMQGIGKTKTLDASEFIQLPHVHFFTGKSFEPIEVGKTKTSHRPGEIGPEIGFGKEMTKDGKDGKDVYLIKFAASGMPLHHGWNGNKWIGGSPAKGRTNFYPGLTPTDPNTGRLYKAMTKRFTAGITALKASGHTPKIRGFVWMQGEQDSKNKQSASEYAASLKQLRRRLSEDFSTPKLPMVFGQVLPHTPALERFTHRDTIRAQMAAADSQSGKAESIPLVSMVSTDSFPLKKDTVHYNAQGQLMLGKAMAIAMRELLNLKK